MGIFKSKAGPNEDPRKVTERRTQDQKWRHDRRVRPDRRLNNISVESIPFSEVIFSPIKRETPGCGYKNREKVTPRIERSLVCVFKNKLDPHADLRKVAERRVQEQLRPFNRRVHPDRRLNNISVKWIT